MNNNNIQINGSVSCMDLLHLQEAIEEVNASPITGLHYDVVDGRFNECFILGDLILEKIRPLTNKPIAVHLAVEDPDKYIRPMIRAGADYVCIHYESRGDLITLFKRIRQLGAKPVLAFRSDTEVPDDFERLAKECEWILKLTVNPGFSAQKIQPEALKHIRKMRDRLDRANIQIGIEADGNINSKTIPEVIRSGATILTGGTSGLFHSSGSVNDHYKKMMEACML